MKRPPFWATALTIAGVLVLCGLGTWQIQRLHWKESLLQKIDAVYSIDAASNPLTIDDLKAAAQRGEPYLRGSVHGHFLPKKFLRGSPHPLDGNPGSYLYMPLQLDGGGAVLVNRGWVPAGPLTVETPQASVAISGLFKFPAKGNVFTPPNIPEQQAWYRIDLAQIAAAKGLENLAPYVLYAEGDKDSLPKPVDLRVTLNNNHLAYAIFWFAMAGVLIVIYTLRFIVQDRQAAQP